MNEKTCETCKHFEAKAISDIVPICHHEQMQIHTGPNMYWSFQPPTYDGSDFGCRLHETAAGADAER